MPRQDPPHSTSFSAYILDDPEFGRMAYTISILLMFSLLIVMLMIRSIKRSSSSVQMEALLEAMRFREELDLQERQRKRLMKAKSKVTAWLSKTNGEFRGWKSSPALMQQRRTTSSTVSEIPRVVVTTAGDGGEDRSRTPCLSLLYSFTEEQNECISPSSRSSYSYDIGNEENLTINEPAFNLSSETCIVQLSEDTV